MGRGDALLRGDGIDILGVTVHTGDKLHVTWFDTDAKELRGAIGIVDEVVPLIGFYLTALDDDDHGFVDKEEIVGISRPN